MSRWWQWVGVAGIVLARSCLDVLHHRSTSAQVTSIPHAQPLGAAPNLTELHASGSPETHSADMLFGKKELECITPNVIKDNEILHEVQSLL